mgnify:CR=1 FL=1
MTENIFNILKGFFEEKDVALRWTNLNIPFNTWACFVPNLFEIGLSMSLKLRVLKSWLNQLNFAIEN